MIGSGDIGFLRELAEKFSRSIGADMDSVTYYANAAVVFKFFTDRGLTLEQACGVLAQADAESTLRPAVVGDHGEAHGLFQLHEERTAAIKRGCGIDVAIANVAQQCAAVWWELQHSEHRAYRALLAAITADEAGQVMCRLYERPASALQPAKRGQCAEKWKVYFLKNPVSS